MTSVHPAPTPPGGSSTAPRPAGPGSPTLHDTVVCVRAPLMAVCDRDGQIRGTGAHGFYFGDHRSLSRMVLTVDGAEPSFMAGGVVDATRAVFHSHCHASGAGNADSGQGDPEIQVVRERALQGGEIIVETVSVANRGSQPVSLEIVFEIACEHGGVDEVKAGLAGDPGTVHEVRERVLGWRSAAAPIGHESRRTQGTTVSAEPPAEVSTAGQPAGGPPTVGFLTWRVDLDPAAHWGARVLVRQPSPPHKFPFEHPRTPAAWTSVGRTRNRRPIDALLRNSLADLDALRLTTADTSDSAAEKAGTPAAQNASPGSTPPEFVAAGAPWYATLFGRDSIWAARMLLPLDTGLALGTLAMLSRYQGTRDDPRTDEQPGKIPHELRAAPTEHGGALALPPVYYGSVDATPLFAILIVEVWRRCGVDAVRHLLPSLRAALAWLERQAGDHEAGFLSYTPQPGQLSHQGWKDSPAAVAFASGRTAHAPIALCEVQGYAYEAAIGAAQLLKSLPEPGAEQEAADWRAWAEALKTRFRKHFWIEDPDGSYPAIALDHTMEPVDGPSSNIGHLLSGGILEDDETEQVTRLLLSKELYSGWGIRTRSEKVTGYNPYGYHCGSVWPHDTAITIMGVLSRDPRAARKLATGLLDASAAFGHRLPELFSGVGRGPDAPRPIPVAAACFPQAWASASSIVIAQALGVIEA